jgi:DNA-binding response OmpR family regulator
MSLPAPPTTGKFRILVVEDDQNIARLVLTTLTRAGFECRYAPDGNEGLTAFRSGDPHLVLTDIMMPGMNGQELVLKIRETSTVPIIMMTAADSEAAQIQGFKGGADDYVAKPFNPKMMTARIIAHLRRVYRYDFAEKKTTSVAQEKTEEKPKVPAGWGQCQRCEYMGPRERFATEVIDGEPMTVCPSCGEAEHVAYSIG